ncbi:hypothetical protein RF55_12423 [Lasius niger]|uniref:Uncharacterized protein n=1 Tax=Lasius niger TaxID=67767 RepID=A0A0J7KCL4_LASNI|nr:hypothetical protein RF55_12423 [Lasius niger]
MRGFTPPWGFGGPPPPTTGAPPQVTPLGGPHGRFGQGRRSPALPYTPWRPAVPTPVTSLPAKGTTSLPAGRFGRGNGPDRPGVHILAAGPRLGNVRAAPAADPRGTIRAMPLG